MVDWDKRYADAEAPLFGGAANNYVVQTVARADFGARSALCIADGDGRNGRYLARQGLDVTGVDISTIGTEQAIALDEADGVKVERVAADLAQWQPKPERCWGAVFLIYLHCEEQVRRRAVALAAAHLEPGGWFVAEGFAANFSDGPRMGPGNTSLLYDAAEFDQWLPGFELIEALTGVIRLQEGSKHQGLAQVVRYTARSMSSW